MPTELHTTEDFKAKTKTGFSLVDFWAEWCGPCKIMGPIFEQVESMFIGKVAFFKVDVDEVQDVPAQLGISGIPTMVLFKNGAEVDRLVGAVPKSKLTTWLEGKMA